MATRVEVSGEELSVAGDEVLHAGERRYELREHAPLGFREKTFEVSEVALTLLELAHQCLRRSLAHGDGIHQPATLFFEHALSAILVYPNGSLVVELRDESLFSPVRQVELGPKALAPDGRSKSAARAELRNHFADIKKLVAMDGPEARRRSLRASRAGRWSPGDVHGAPAGRRVDRNGRRQLRELCATSTPSFFPSNREQPRSCFSVPKGIFPIPNIEKPRQFPRP